MKHNKVKKYLSRYISGLLPDRQHQEIEAHISACEECRDEISKLGDMISVLKAKPTAKLSSREFERIKLHASLQYRKEPSAPEREEMRIFSPIFVISFLLFLVSTIFIGKQITAELTGRQLFLVSAFIYLQVTGIIAFFIVLYAKKDKLRLPFRFIRNLIKKYGIIK